MCAHMQLHTLILTCIFRDATAAAPAVRPVFTGLWDVFSVRLTRDLMEPLVLHLLKKKL